MNPVQMAKWAVLCGPSAKKQHVEHEGGEAEAVAKLLGGHRAAGDEEIARLGPREEHERQLGQIHGRHHDRQHSLEAVFGRREAAQQAAAGQGQDAEGAIGQADLAGGQAQAARAAAVEQKRRDDLHELRLVKAVEENEGHRQHHARLLEEGAQGGEELAQRGCCG